MRLREGLFYVLVYGPGFGESVVLVPPAGPCVVVDGSESRGRSQPASALRELDRPWGCVVLTHPHLDHVLGLPEVLDEIEHVDPSYVGAALPQETFDVDSVPTTNSPGEALRQGQVESMLARIKDAWSRRPESRWDTLRGSELSLGDVRLQVLHPPSEYVERRELCRHPNRLSSVIVVSWCKLRVLLAGDVEKVDWCEIVRHVGRDGTRPGEHRALKVPHHGSPGSDHESWQVGSGRRMWIVTPFARGGCILPEFLTERGIERLLQFVGAVYVTSLPPGMRGGARQHKTSDPYAHVRWSVFDESTRPEEDALVCLGFDAAGNLRDTWTGPRSGLVVKLSAKRMCGKRSRLSKTSPRRRGVGRG